jgi:hypothetical protein
MNTDIDLTYHFLWNTEAINEQLQVIMQEVSEDIFRESERMEQ